MVRVRVRARVSVRARVRVRDKDRVQVGVRVRIKVGSKYVYLTMLLGRARGVVSCTSRCRTRGGDIRGSSNYISVTVS